MRRLASILALSTAFAALWGAALAQPDYASRVNVTVGPLLAEKSKSYGPREISFLTTELQKDVARALAARNAPVSQVDLVIEDAQPNRPTFDQLGRSIGLSLRSVGLGGAQISGTITQADGSVRPIRYQYYEDDLRQERATSTWTDAERVFDTVSDQIASGRISMAYRGEGPSREGGLFGYPYNH